MVMSVGRFWVDNRDSDIDEENKGNCGWLFRELGACKKTRGR